MTLAEELASKWNKTPETPPPRKKTPLKKPKKKKEVAIVTDEQLEKAFNNPSGFEDDELYEESAKAKLELDILKAENMRIKNEQEELKLKKEAGELIEYAMADYLFIGYMEFVNTQLLTFMRKIEPDIKNYCNENLPHEIEKLVNKGLSQILKDAKKEQKKEAKNWKTEL